MSYKIENFESKNNGLIKTDVLVEKLRKKIDSYDQIIQKMKIIERVLDGYSRIEKINIVSINEKPLIGVLLLLILTFLPVLILLYFI